jgi:hypothetical protein
MSKSLGEITREYVEASEALTAWVRATPDRGGETDARLIPEFERLWKIKNDTEQVYMSALWRTGDSEGPGRADAAPVTS